MLVASISFISARTGTCTDSDVSIDSKTIDEWQTKNIAGLDVEVITVGESITNGTFSSNITVRKSLNMNLSSEGKLSQSIAYEEGLYIIELLTAIDTSVTIRVINPSGVGDSK